MGTPKKEMLQLFSIPAFAPGVKGAKMRIFSRRNRKAALM